MTAAPPVQGMVTIDDGPLSLADLCAVARGAHLQLGPAARARIADARAVVDEAVDGPDLIYGLNTGLGHMRDDRMPVAGRCALYQDGMVGATSARSAGRSRRAWCGRRCSSGSAGFAHGGSGISPAVADDARRDARTGASIPSSARSALSAPRTSCTWRPSASCDRDRWARGIPGRGADGRGGDASSRPGAGRAPAEGRPRADLGERRVGRDGRPRRRPGAPPGSRRRPGGGALAGVGPRQPLDRRPERRPDEADSGPARVGDAIRAFLEGSDRACRAAPRRSRTHCRSGSRHRSTARIAKLRAHSRESGRDRACVE